MGNVIDIHPADDELLEFEALGASQTLIVPGFNSAQPRGATGPKFSYLVTDSGQYPPRIGEQEQES